MTALLELDRVDVRFQVGETDVSAVSDVSLQISEGEIFGLVGESGCGKTTLALALIGLLPRTADVRGAIRFQGRDLIGLSDDQMRRLRGDRISMVFQDPMTSLDPCFAIGDQVAETIRAHRPVDRRAARDHALQLLHDVGIPEAGRRYNDPPHHLSGGMRQRVVIATAVANEPALLLADEPTTALDVTIQSQVLDLLRELRRTHHTTILLITHDLGVVAQLCDRVGVMYAGQLVEVAPVEEIFRAPRHPYTQALLAALPTSAQERGALRVIEGRVPDLSDPPPGCRFAPRCPHRMTECDLVPPIAAETPDHLVACWLSEATQAAAGTSAAKKAKKAAGRSGGSSA
ncbi:MAG: ABC transporter ATP-binding protein [Chloroflexota bacterium]|nr:ABC transporter ATP-binding protein [Chloroflexota bacterium]